MKWIGALVVVTWAALSWGQSLGDVARANRERPKQPAAKVYTNEDFKSSSSAHDSGAPGNLQQELDDMRRVFRQICSDPKTERGRKLSDYDKQQIDHWVQPLLRRVKEYERIQKGYKDELEALDREMEVEVRKAWPADRPYAQDDMERLKRIREDYEARKTSLVKNAERELQGFLSLQKDLESVAEACPEAARTVPD